MSETSASFSIRQVIDLTGLSEFTLRGWERRYKAFKPVRTTTGRRAYSNADLRKALLLRELTLRNHKIGDIAKLSVKNLESLLDKVPRRQHGRPAGRFEDEIAKVIRQISLQNWDEAERRLRRFSKNQKPRILLSEFIAPLMQDLGTMVSEGTISVAQEHVFTSMLKERLYMVREMANDPRRASRFVVATPEGDLHELGVLLAHTILAHAGFKSLYIGPNTPKDELCETALRFGVSHVILGCSVSKKEGAKDDLYTYIHFLDQHLDQEVGVWTGGRTARLVPTETSREIAWFSSLQEFENVLGLLD